MFPEDPTMIGHSLDDLQDNPPKRRSADMPAASAAMVVALCAVRLIAE
jgi:hypothetical protein